MIIGMIGIAIGTYLMIQKKEQKTDNTDGEVKELKNKAWLLYASLSAVFASLTSILAKIGIENVESNLGTAIRTIVVLIMSWIIVFITKKQHEVRNIDRRSLAFIVLSGLATGGSWLCYYKALQDGLASVVVPIDKLSILVTVGFAYIFLKEKLSKKSVIGLCLIVAGTLALLIKI
ncbi:EamA family transporter [Clostridium saudiense]|nr:EamA family transporter [Clostridium saudiense]